MKYIQIVEQSIEGFTAILPGLSYKSIPQKLIDLLITSKGVIHIGRLDSEYILPSISIDFHEIDKLKTKGDNISTSIEVYAIPGKKIVIFQQMMPALCHKMMNLTKEYIQFLECKGVSQFVVLGSLGPKSNVIREMIEGKVWYEDVNEGFKVLKVPEDVKELISSIDQTVDYKNEGIFDNTNSLAETETPTSYMDPLTSGYLYETEKDQISSSLEYYKRKYEGKKGKDDNKYKIFHQNNKSIGNTLTYLECTKLPAVALITTKTGTVRSGCEDLGLMVKNILGVEIGPKPLIWDEEW